MKILIKIVCGLLVCLLLSSCTMFRQPAQPDGWETPNQPQQPNNPQQPPPTRGTPIAEDVAEDISSRTAEVSGVYRASTIVIGNLALIGVELRDGQDHEHVKKMISNDIEENFAQIDNALVSADPEIENQIAATANKIRQGRPTQEVFDDIYAIWDRMRPE